MKRAAYGYYIGNASDPKIQYKGSSGGMGSAITKYLLETKMFDTAITFRFNQEACKYLPVIIHDAQDLNIYGSIYQDIDIPRFVKEHIDEIGNGAIVSCPPCQVGAVKHILKINARKSFIISFCCSGQTTVEGTWKYYQLLGIDKKDVVKLQYRGNGWPSGIQIWLKDGKRIYKDNYTEPWVTVHNSMLYKPERCFFCKFDTNYQSDISLADPWLEPYIGNDNIGHTMFIVNTILGKNVIDLLTDNNIIRKKEINYEDYWEAQRNNINKAINSKRCNNAYKVIIRLRKKKLYFWLFSSSYYTLRACLWVNRFILRVFKRSV